MENRQRVFIRGVKDRGSEVVKMLEDRGGRKNCYLDGANSVYLYFINHKGFITFAFFDSEFGKIIMDCYTELHLPEKWKDGDILVDNDKPTKFLVKSNAWAGGWENCFKAYLFVNPTHIQESPIPIFCDANYHKADSEEVRQFHEFLHKHGKDWDADKKQLVDWKWKPKDGEEYWFFTGSNTIIWSVWKDTLHDNKYFDFGNCFQTKEEAEAAAERVKKALKGE